MDDYLPEYMRCLIKRNRKGVSDFEPSSGNYCVAGHCAVTSKREGRGLQWIMSMLPRSITDALGMGGDDSGDDTKDREEDCLTFLILLLLLLRGDNVLGLVVMVTSLG